MNWNDRLKGLGSDREIGRNIHKLWPTDDPRRAEVRASSMGTMVGQLRSGNDRWWRRSENASARSALAELLELDEADLFPNLGREELSEWGFPEFPALNPLDPRNEPLVAASVARLGDWDPPAIRDLVSLAAAPQGLTWIFAPSGCGKSFARRFAGLRVRQALIVESLMDAVPKLQAGIAVIEVLRPDPARDSAALELLASLATHLTVLAPFSRPLASGYASSAEFGEPSVAIDEDAAPKTRDREKTWADWHWLASPEARRNLVRWSVRRVPEGSLLEGESESVLNWLDQIDPIASQFGKPADILWLLQRFHALGVPVVKRNGLTGLVGDLIEQRAADTQAEDPVLAAWLRDSAAEMLRGIAKMRWLDLTLSVDGALARAGWERLVPDYLCKTDAHDLWREFTRAKTKSELLPAHLDRPRPEVAIGRLVRANLLSRMPDDQLQLAPPWLSQHLSEGSAIESLERPDDLGWGRLCYCPSRRSIVDAQLLSLAKNPAVAAAHIDRLPETGASAGDIAAIDAWFVAIGQLCLTGNSLKIATSPLARLVAGEISMLVRFYNGSSWPLPPPRLGRGGADEFLHTWLACAWAWSTALPKPELDFPNNLAWVFPGWLEPSLDTLQRDLPVHGAYEHRFIEWIAQLAMAQPGAMPAESALDTVWTGWAIGRLYAGEGVQRGSRVVTAAQGSSGAIFFSRGLNARVLDPQPWNEEVVATTVLGWPEALRDRAVRLLTEGVLLRARPFWAGLNAWRSGARQQLRDAALAGLEVGAVVDAIRAPGGYSPGDIEHLVRVLPPRFHLQAIQTVAEFAKHDITLINSGAAIEIALSRDAIEWLAFNTTWPMARTWARLEPERALAWLMNGGLAHPFAQHVLPALIPEVQERALDWAETLPIGEQKSLIAWWAMYAMTLRPDLIDRWWALCWRMGGPDWRGESRGNE